MLLSVARTYSFIADREKSPAMPMDIYFYVEYRLSTVYFWVIIFIYVPRETWNIHSGGIELIFGYTYLITNK